MKTIVILVLATIFGQLHAQNTLTKADLEQLDNTSWEGEIMYVNYGDGKEVYLPTTLQVKIKGRKIIMNTQYTNESSANGTGVIEISKDGTWLGEEKIIEKITGPNRELTIVTSFEGYDDERPAKLFKTYLITPNSFSITKKVFYENSDEPLIRNKYTYSKL